MTTGARTPEELDTILEDAFLLRDRAAFHELFEDDAVLVETGGVEARGGEAIRDALADLWNRDCTYVARSGRVLRARDAALVVSSAAIHVLRRGGDGTWRAAISLLNTDPPTETEDT